MSDDHGALDSLLVAFEGTDPLRTRVYRVLSALPSEVQRDFTEDPRFCIRPLTRKSSCETLLAFPAPDGSVSRCVVLKKRLASCSLAFGLYVIAHELAHAYLRNGSWNQFADPEEAADALAASWGFDKPTSWF
ncbi:MAG: hypothetical protein L7W43_16125 [Rubripirellula sp.]|nr:hypothetical protein [Rubripirellula sp.]